MSNEKNPRRWDFRDGDMIEGDSVFVDAAAYDELARKLDIAKNALHQTWSWLDSEGLADESPGEFKWLIKEVLKEIEK